MDINGLECQCPSPTCHTAPLSLWKHADYSVIDVVTIEQVDVIYVVMPHVKKNRHMNK